MMEKDASDSLPPVKPKVNIVLLGIVFFSLLVLVVAVWTARVKKGVSDTPFYPGSKNGIPEKIEKFASEAEFREYLSQAKDMSQMGRVTSDVMIAPRATMEEPTGLATTKVERYSQTNIQTPGVDEPDILKTDGKRFYYWAQGVSFGINLPERPVEMDIKDSFREPAPPIDQSKIKIISALPPSQIAKISEISEAGEMLLSSNNLMIFTSEGVVSYDVGSDSPSKKWELNFSKSSARIIASRLMDGKLYLVTQNYIDEFSPCDIPLSTGVVITCKDIYRPDIIISADLLTTAMVVDPNDGAVEKKVSFISSESTVTYMSSKNLYVTYAYNSDYSLMMYDFLRSQASDLVPEFVVEKVRKIGEYDISLSSKVSEIQRVIDQYKSSLGKDERLRFENELNNRLSLFIKERARDLERTGIVKINVDNFGIEATGSVAGKILNQFSIDEFNGYLRIATTSGGSWMGMASSSVNDVYVLDNGLRKVGEVVDLGVGERIYSVRFIGKSGYVVTFRQTDPFYVIDLSNPSRPKKVGELKIPGYSSYLHPLKDDLILGVGQEGSQVKLSVFDVSDAGRPVEVGKYTLNEYWTEVQNNHHAFLSDPERQIFFIPGGQGGYIFSYKNTLQLEKAVSLYAPKRAAYINNFFYIFGDRSIDVYDQDDWELIKSLDLK
jgi:uncharacterized secreted protein with C-terminal beta-propeller domain